MNDPSQLHVVKFPRELLIRRTIHANLLPGTGRPAFAGSCVAVVIRALDFCWTHQNFFVKPPTT